MDLDFQQLNNEVDGLVEFLTSDSWLYHVNPNPKEEAIWKDFDKGYYDSKGSKTFWILLDNNIRVGLIRVFDLDDGTPLFDIRISAKYRGLGIGTQAVCWMVKHVFQSYPDKDRIEGYTRQDNYGMRAVFIKSGFVKEAHHRKAWPSTDGRLYDSVGYGILREDWERGMVTPVNWDDISSQTD